MSKHRRYCFLWNNFNADDILHIKSWMEKPNVVYGVLKSNLKNRWLRGFVHFKNQITFKSFGENFCLKRASVVVPKIPDEEIRNTFLECEKIVFEFGETAIERRKIKKQNELDTLKIEQYIRCGHSRRNIMSLFPQANIMFVERLFEYLEPGRNWEMKVYWFWGTSNEKIINNYCNGRHFRITSSLKWWDGYDREEDVIIIRPKDNLFDFHQLRYLFGNTPYIVETKWDCGFRQFVAKRICVVSDKHPVDLYKNINENIESLLWKITEIKHVV